jgi:choline dehydrogenase-like flavoprotein
VSSSETVLVQDTTLSRDVPGRYICNTLTEALDSTTRSGRADARDFDIIVVGGGTFGSAVAQELFSNDLTAGHRILVLEGGPFVIPEHVQNMPLLGLDVDGATLTLPNGQVVPKTINNLRAIGQDQVARREVWGLAWHSVVGFPGLAYCLGGRSLYWGGWSPRLLDGEMPSARWPAAVVTALKNTYFDEASAQIGVKNTNDFIHGPLHEALRKQLLDGINSNQISHVVPLAELPLSADVPPGASIDEAKLEAPLAVQSKPERPGFFPFNKFSAMQLLIKAARAAQAESGGDDVKKRLMVVPNCHVKQLVFQAGRVTQVLTNQEAINVPATGNVIIALGTIESIRLALLSFQGTPNYGLIGKNLMAHLRSNRHIRISREALQHLPATVKELQASALFVKGRFTRSDASVGHFHQQITASGLGFIDNPDSEAELFKKVPDIDTFDVFRNADDGAVVITIRGIGEMVPNNPLSSVNLHGELDENLVQRAVVSIHDARSAPPSDPDRQLWDAMDQNAMDIANVFAGGQPLETLGFGRDGPGTTHHETGGLDMGDSDTTSVTNPNARFWHVSNAYVAGPALLPTIRSPNPMLTGIALTRRLADHLIPKPVAPTAEAGFELIFDGLSANRWRMSTITNQPPHISNPGNAIIRFGALEMVTGNDLGLLWYTKPMPADFILKLEWLRFRHEDNSGVFVRFPHPDSKNFNNTAFVAVVFGFEVQIDELGAPNGLGIHRTGAIYNEPSQTLTLQPANSAGQWNEFEIRIQGQTYTVLLNGTQVTTFTNTDPNRGQSTTVAAPSFIGLQTYPGSRMAYRNIRFKEL